MTERKCVVCTMAILAAWQAAVIWAAVVALHWGWTFVGSILLIMATIVMVLCRAQWVCREVSNEG